MSRGGDYDTARDLENTEEQLNSERGCSANSVIDAELLKWVGQL